MQYCFHHYSFYLYSILFSHPASIYTIISFKVVATQLAHYRDINNLFPIYQSGFRKGHSTETLLVRLLSDIYGAIDKSEVTLLALFDASAAFDTVDHQILLQRLSISFALSGNILGWL